MDKDNHHVLITCTQPRADFYVRGLKSSDIMATARPALIIRPITNPVPNKNFNAMVITSRHALSGNILLPDLPVIAVGEETATLAQDRGFQVIATGTGGIQDLNLDNYQELLYPCAGHPSYVPANLTPWPIYRADDNPDFQVEPVVTHIAVFSMRAASIVRPHLQQQHQVICLSSAIADVFADHPPRNIAVCTHPRYDTMIQLIQKTLQADI